MVPETCLLEERNLASLFRIQRSGLTIRENSWTILLPKQKSESPFLFQDARSSLADTVAGIVNPPGNPKSPPPARDRPFSVVPAKHSVAMV